MKKTNYPTMSVKKSYEETLDDDICNFNLSDKSDGKLDTYNSNKIQNQLQKSNFKKNSSGKKSKRNSKTGLSSLNVSENTHHTSNYLPTITLTEGDKSNAVGGNIMELIDSLKDKISLYENEIKNLIEEKVQMQLTINNLQLSSYTSTKKSGKLNSSKSPLKTSTSQKNEENANSNSNSLAKSTDSAFELNKYYIQEASGLNKEIKNLKSNIERQKALLEQNNSILEESVFIEEDNKGNYEITNVS